MTVYFISGLAADSSIFKHIQLPPHCTAVHLHWIPPLPNESLSQYAHRLGSKINTTEKFALIGLSFGGMLATELAKKLQPAITILISSVPLVRHLPVYFKVAGFLRLQKIVPVRFIQHAALLKRLFTKETPEDKKMLKQMIRKSDAQFIKWAMNAIVTWQNKELPANLFHIHGTRDEILPLRFTKPTHTISNSGHLMVLVRATEINQILNNVFLAEVAAQKAY